MWQFRVVLLVLALAFAFACAAAAGDDRPGSTSCREKNTCQKYITKKEHKKILVKVVKAVRKESILKRMKEDKVKSKEEGKKRKRARRDMKANILRNLLVNQARQDEAQLMSANSDKPSKRSSSTDSSSTASSDAQRTVPLNGAASVVDSSVGSSGEKNDLDRNLIEAAKVLDKAAKCLSKNCGRKLLSKRRSTSAKGAKTRTPRARNGRSSSFPTARTGGLKNLKLMQRRQSKILREKAKLKKQIQKRQQKDKAKKLKVKRTQQKEKQLRTRLSKQFSALSRAEGGRVPASIAAKEQKLMNRLQGPRLKHSTVRKVNRFAKKMKHDKKVLRKKQRRAKSKAKKRSKKIKKKSLKMQQLMKKRAATQRKLVLKQQRRQKKKALKAQRRQQKRQLQAQQQQQQQSAVVPAAIQADVQSKALANAQLISNLIS